jgi:TRAP-type C4-dicarboxylate transport system permease small subunit
LRAPKEEGVMKKLLLWVNENLEAALSSFFLMVMTVLITIQIVCRIIGLPLSWTEEIARYTFVWLIYISCSYAIKKRAHIKLDLLTIMAKPLAKLVFDVIANIGFLTFALVLAYWCALGVYRLKEVNYQVSPAVGIPMWIANFALLAGFVLMVYRTVSDTVLLVRDYIKTRKGGVS